MAVNRMCSFLEQLIYKQVVFQFCICSCTIIKKPKVYSFGLGIYGTLLLLLGFFLFILLSTGLNLISLLQNPLTVFLVKPES